MEGRKDTWGLEKKNSCIKKVELPSPNTQLRGVCLILGFLLGLLFP
jgi:hypothetical protein